MEPSGCNWWQPVANGRRRERLRRAKTVAVGCDQLPKEFHGKEGSTVRVRPRALQKRCKRAFLFRTACRCSRLRWVWSHLWSLQVEEAPSLDAKTASSDRHADRSHGRPGHAACWSPALADSLSASVAEHDIADVRPLFGKGRA